MDDLITWLRSQLDDDEQIANAAARDAGEPVWSAGDEFLSESVTTAETRSYIASGPYAGLNWEIRQHIAEYDPARVLREVEAKRRLVELHQPANPDAVPCEGYAGWPDKPWFYCATCGSGEPNEYPITWPCETIKLVALPYADRPGYLDTWRP